MRKVALHLMLTLDGCVCGPEGELGWVFAIEDPEREKYSFELYREMGGVLVGSVTYQDMANYWPGAANEISNKESEREFAHLMNNIPKFVFSNSMKQAEWQNSTVIRGDLASEVFKLKQLPGKDLVLSGGHRLAQSFVKLGLIDDYYLFVHPVVLGKGKRLFDLDSLEEQLQLKLVTSQAFASGVVLLHYQKA